MSTPIESRRAVLEDGREGIILPMIVEFRDDGTGMGPDYFTMTGHAAVFNSLSEDLGGFREIIQPGAFRNATASSLVHLLWNHDSSRPLASTDSGTLDLQEDGDGLRIWARIPKALSYAQDLRTLYKEKIVRGMSFAFKMPADGSGEVWSQMDDGSGLALRRLTDVKELFDASPVTRGAYTAPAFSMRSLFEARATQLDAQADPAVTLDPNAAVDPQVVTLDATVDPSVRDTERSIRIAAMRANVALALCPER